MSYLRKGRARESLIAGKCHPAKAAEGHRETAEEHRGTAEGHRGTAEGHRERVEPWMNMSEEGQ